MSSPESYTNDCLSDLPLAAFDLRSTGLPPSKRSRAAACWTDADADPLVERAFTERRGSGYVLRSWGTNHRRPYRLEQAWRN
jgi:hypothetical protein